MKIGLFTDTYFPQINGVGTSTYTLANQLRKLGHTVYIFTPSDPSAKEGPYEEGVIRMPSMPFIFLKSFRVGLVYSPLELTKIAMLNLDIIHTQTEFSLGMFGKTLSKCFHIPMVHTYHTMYEDYVHYIVNGYLINTSMAHFLSRIFCNFASEVIAPTAKVRKSLLEYQVSKPITVIPTGIDTKKFQKEYYRREDTLKLKMSLGLNPEDKVILFVGRIAKEKSIDTILEALPNVFKKTKNTKFLVIGDGPHRPALEETARNLGISHRVVFAGSKPWADIGQFYQVGDIFVSASVSETQGITFIEAMAAALPVLAKNDPCIEGVINHGENGLVFENREELSSQILKLLRDEPLYRQISANGESFAKNLSEERFARKVEGVYKMALEDAVLRGEQPITPHMPHILSDSSSSLRIAGKSRVYNIKRRAQYELIQIKRATRKINKIALSPVESIIKYRSDKDE